MQVWAQKSLDASPGMRRVGSVTQTSAAPIRSSYVHGHVSAVGRLPTGRLRMTRGRSGSLQLQRMKTSNHNTLPVYPAHGDAMSTSQHSQLPVATTDRTSLREQPFMAPAIEILDAAEMAARLKVKESWVVEESKPSRTSDPIPVFRLGKHRRYRWGSPEMNAWLWRRLKESSPYNRATTRG